LQAAALVRAVIPRKPSCGNTKRQRKVLPIRQALINFGHSKLGKLEIRLKTLPLVLILSAVGSPVHAQSLRVYGQTGYLSEWEVSGNVAESRSGRVREFSGSLTMTHVGLCSQAGPEEKVTEIKLQIPKSGLLPRFHATMTMEGSKCIFSGTFSDTYNGLMECDDAKGVPVTLSFK
jgi:hypothetical protein